MELKLKIAELLQAKVEVIELLSNDMDYPQKLPLLDLYDVLEDSIKNFEKVKSDLYKEYGKLNAEGNYALDIFTDDSRTQLSEAYQKVQSTLSEISQQEKVINFTPIKLSSLGGVKMKSPGKVFRSFIEN